jgi:hypothetical protein
VHPRPAPRPDHKACRRDAADERRRHRVHRKRARTVVVLVVELRERTRRGERLRRVITWELRQRPGSPDRMRRTRHAQRVLWRDTESRHDRRGRWGGERVSGHDDGGRRHWAGERHGQGRGSWRDAGRAHHGRSAWHDRSRG